MTVVNMPTTSSSGSTRPFPADSFYAAAAELSVESLNNQFPYPVAPWLQRGQMAQSALCIHAQATNTIVIRPSSPLNSDIGSWVDVVFKGMGDIMIHDCTGHWVHVVVGNRVAGRGEADAMTLLINNNSDLDP